MDFGGSLIYISVKFIEISIDLHWDEKCREYKAVKQYQPDHPTLQYKYIHICIKSYHYTRTCLTYFPSLHTKEISMKYE